MFFFIGARQSNALRCHYLKTHIWAVCWYKNFVHFRNAGIEVRQTGIEDWKESWNGKTKKNWHHSSKNGSKKFHDLSNAYAYAYRKMHCKNFEILKFSRTFRCGASIKDECGSSHDYFQHFSMDWTHKLILTVCKPTITKETLESFRQIKPQFVFHTNAPQNYPKAWK